MSQLGIGYEASFEDLKLIIHALYEINSSPADKLLGILEELNERNENFVVIFKKA